MLDRRQALINYLWSCAHNFDWHGVRDAACDIEIVEAQIKTYDEHAPPF